MGTKASASEVGGGARASGGGGLDRRVSSSGVQAPQKPRQASKTAWGGRRREGKIGRLTWVACISNIGKHMGLDDLELAI